MHTHTHTPTHLHARFPHHIITVPSQSRTRADVGHTLGCKEPDTKIIGSVQMSWSLCGSIACKTRVRSTHHHQPQCNEPHMEIQPEGDRLWSSMDRSEGAPKRRETLVACFHSERDDLHGDNDARLQAEREHQQRVHQHQERVNQERFQAKRKAFIRQAVSGAPDMSILGAPFFRVEVCRPTV